MTDKIGRRQILSGGNRHGGAWAVGKSTGLCDRKAPSENGNDMGENFPGLGTAPENIAKRVRDMTDGQLELKICRRTGQPV